MRTGFRGCTLILVSPAFQPYKTMRVEEALEYP
jgi:hypothetical protein